MSQYRRIIIDESSSDDNADSEDVDEAGESVSESDESSDTNIHCLLETLNLTKRNTYGYRVDRTDDEETSIDEDTYLEDSFVIKDYTSEESFPNTLSDNQSFEEKRSIRKRQRRKTIQKEADKGTSEISSFFRNDLLGVTIDDKNVSTLLELYPELKENTNLKENPSKTGSTETRGESAEIDEDGDEKFEKYLEEIKTQSSFTKAYELRDLNEFIMTDSESIIECSSDCESNLSDKSDDVQLIGEVRKSTGDEKIRHHNTQKNTSGEHAAHWHHPVTEKEIKGEEHANLWLGPQSAPIVKGKTRDDDEIFLLALSQNGPVDQNAQKYTTAKFPRLDPNMVLEWNARLRLTAGRCRCKPNGTADVELSTKVCDSPERLRDTLLHELCHAAVWVIDRIHKGGHGSAWKYWVYKCRKVFPSLPLIERCHNYTVDAKYLYICDNCGQTIKRHSKSLDTDRKICGICQGHFVLRSRDGKELSTKTVSTFAQFVKENYNRERKPGEGNGFPNERDHYD
ncbi:unnamed protein product [Litomosoides sigmodontis]|uniref:SprT-like domain-containing protein n=1 Tax=Litomosoides sigmodontis TaxID=42156 RepID=A0A3P6TWV4_LITSI|nr:unnamed protein product [Litomosoides sigmodontis]